MPRKHPHYFKSVAHLQEVDVYRVLALFAVTDQALGHAIKKLLVAGGRGVKDQRKDIQEAIDTLQRRLEMEDEDAAVGAQDPTGASAEPWVEWAGGESILGKDTIVRVRQRSGFEAVTRSDSARWYHLGRGNGADIVAYQLVR